MTICKAVLFTVIKCSVVVMANFAVLSSTSYAAIPDSLNPGSSNPDTSKPKLSNTDSSVKTKNTANPSPHMLELFTEAEKNFIASKKVLIVCNVLQQASENASLKIVRLIAEKSGLVFEATPLIAWAKALEELNSGNCDILPWATKTVARSEYMNFTRPYVRIKRVVITRQQEYYFRDLDEVVDRVFVMLRSNHAVAQIRNNYPNIKFVYVDTIQDELDYIAEGKAFGTIVSIYSAANLFNNEHKRELKVSGVLPAVYDDIASLATTKDNALLHRILEKSLLATDPRHIEEFMTEGAVVSFNPDVNYQKYWWAVLTVIFVVSVLTWWNRYLKNLNAQLTDSKRKLELLSVTDPLTKTYNRLKMDEVFTQEIRSSKRYCSPLSVIMIDIDYFKRINDQFGHTVGDRVLEKIAQLTKSNLRTNDFLGRWGGEEFLIICPSTDIKNVHVTAEKLRITLEKTKFPEVDNVTASFGVAEWKVGENQESLISRADSALYRSKNAGRNRVSD